MIPLGVAAAPRRQVKFKTAIQLLEARGQTRYGEGPKKSVVSEAGEFLFIPRDLSHQPVNLGQKEAAEVIVARNDASGSETLVPYDPAE